MTVVEKETGGYKFKKTSDIMNLCTYLIVEFMLLNVKLRDFSPGVCSASKVCYKAEKFVACSQFPALFYPLNFC